ncbi:MAG: carbohydrate-binding protein, partial [Cytophagaceae bacterium]
AIALTVSSYTDTRKTVELDATTLSITSAINSVSVPVPGRIEAENFVSMQGIGLETTDDQGGGQNINSIDTGDWLTYSINVAQTGVYSFRFRVANGYGDGSKFQIRLADGTALSTVDVPRTGGIQNWQTTGATVHLNAGTQTIQLYVLKGDWNLNWFDITTGQSLPGKVEAESFDVATDVRPEQVTDTDGGLDLNYIDDGDWMDYNVTAPTTGVYTFQFRVANAWGNGRIDIRTESGAVLGSVDVPRTGGWQNWTTISTTATLPAGSQVLRIYSVRGAWSFNWVNITQGGTVLAPSVISFGALPDKTTDDGDFSLVATSTNNQTPITFSSSNPAVLSVSNATGSWKATVVAAGTAILTASQAASSSFLAASDVTQSQVVRVSSIIATERKIPIDPKRWYQLTNVSNGLQGLFDGVTNVNVETGWGKVLPQYDAYYPLLNGESMTLESLRFYDFVGSCQDTPMTLAIITDQWQRIPIATFTGSDYAAWVGPYPDR